MIWLTQGCQAWGWVIWESTAFQSRKRQGDGTVSGERHVQSFLWSFEQLIPRRLKAKPRESAWDHHKSQPSFPSLSLLSSVHPEPKALHQPRASHLQHPRHNHTKHSQTHKKLLFQEEPQVGIKSPSTQLTGLNASSPQATLGSY